MKIKICGIDSIDAALAASENGADYIGFIFAENSPRKIAKSTAKEIAATLGGKIKIVGVFQNQSEEFILDAVKNIPLDIVQLHGCESEDFIKSLKRKCGIEIWKAFTLECEEDLQNAIASSADKILADAPSGGSGKACNWEFAAALASKRPLILAGGLGEENVNPAIAKVSPFAIDANSKLEKSKGVKCPQKIKSFMKKVNEPIRRYGEFGGQYVAETLMPALLELEAFFAEIKRDESFNAEYRNLLADYVGRPTPLYFAKRLSDHCGGAKIWLKREDLNHTGAHKINNALGQALMAKRMGKTRVIAETGAGMHGVATATAAALLGLECCVFMGSEDIERQAPNVERMAMLGAKLISVSTGTATLKDAMNEALRNWVETVADTFYVIGTAAGPAPYPEMVKYFQSTIGIETKSQCLDAFGKLPNEVVACIGGGSNAIGIFAPFIDEQGVSLSGAEAGGSGIASGLHAASLNGGSVGVLHGNKTFLLQDDFGQIQNTHSVSAGLDYPGVGPEHAQLFKSGRAKYSVINDAQAIEAFQILCRLEGIIPALESSHAIALAIEHARKRSADENIVICLSGRGDKDMNSVAKYLNFGKYF